MNIIFINNLNKKAQIDCEKELQDSENGFASMEEAEEFDLYSYLSEFNIIPWLQNITEGEISYW